MFLTYHSTAVLLLRIFLFICVCLCYIVVSVPCSLVVTCLEKADFLTFLCVMFSCVFVTFPFGVLGQVWYLIVSILDLCLLPWKKVHVLICFPNIFPFLSICLFSLKMQNYYIALSLQQRCLSFWPLLSQFQIIPSTGILKLSL